MQTRSQEHGSLRRNPINIQFQAWILNQTLKIRFRINQRQSTFYRHKWQTTSIVRWYSLICPRIEISLRCSWIWLILRACPAQGRSSLFDLPLEPPLASFHWWRVIKVNNLITSTLKKSFRLSHQRNSRFYSFKLFASSNSKWECPHKDKMRETTMVF